MFQLIKVYVNNALRTHTQIEFGEYAVWAQVWYRNSHAYFHGEHSVFHKTNMMLMPYNAEIFLSKRAYFTFHVIYANLTTAQKSSFCITASSNFHRFSHLDAK